MEGHRSTKVWTLVLTLGLVSGCAAAPGATTAAPSGTGDPPDADAAADGSGPNVGVSGPGPGAPTREPSGWIDEAERALSRAEPARAATLLARYLGLGLEGHDEDTARAYRILAQAHERLGDFDAAIRAYDGFLARFPTDPEAHLMLARRGACEAEVGDWDRSAASYAGVLERGAERMVPSQRVEALVRRAFALYQLGRYAEADVAFAEADALYLDASESGEERFSDTYFVAMARFYRAAIIHIEFRAAPIRLPEAQMNADFDTKLALLERAQEAYNEVVRARNLYWVSAAGYQLGSLFEEFHDAIMYAPVPDWLDDSQRRTYYRELEERLRPVIDKAVWVFEKNLETARKFGYENEFIERTEAALAQLQGILLGRGDPGDPVPRLAPRESRAQEADAPMPTDELPAAERKLFVPLPTTL